MRGIVIKSHTGKNRDLNKFLFHPIPPNYSVIGWVQDTSVQEEHSLWRLSLQPEYVEPEKTAGNQV